MTLILNLPADLENRLATEAERHRVTVDAYALDLLRSRLPGDPESAVALLRRWMNESSDQEPATDADWLPSAIDRDRPGQRPLFPSSLKGVTW